MTHPRTHLNHIIDLAQRALANWPTFETTSALLANSTIPGTTRTGVGGGDTPDPVYATQLSHADWDDTANDIATALRHMRNVEKRMTATTREDPETARHHGAAVRAARCTDPTCDDLEVKHGYCYRHLPAHRRECATCQIGGA